MKENRLYEEYLVWEVGKSINFEEIECNSNKINCYAFARGMTYPDEFFQIYAPGKIYQLKYGKGEFLWSSTDFDFIHACVQRDSEAIEQKTIRVSFSEIQEQDRGIYFGIVLFHSFSSELEWHFIRRNSNGIWLHKPNWEQPAEEIQWLEFGKKFQYNRKIPFLKDSIPTEAICAQEFFYRVES